MNNLYQGGQCNQNAGSNGYKLAMNTMLMGSQNPERVMDMNSQGQNYEEQIMQRQMQFKAMNQQWQGSNQLHKTQMAQMQGLMNSELQIAMMEHERMVKQMQEMHWMQGQEQLRKQQMSLQNQFENAKLLQEAESWKKQYIMNGNFDKAKLSVEEEQKNIMNSSGSMLEVMMNDPDPRFQNSQFLHFLKRIQKGDVVIEGKQMKQVRMDQKTMEANWQTAEKMNEQQSFNQNNPLWNEAELINQSNLASMNKQFQEAKEMQKEETMKSQQKLEEHWVKRLEEYEHEYENQPEFEKMLQKKYMDVLKEMNLDLNQSWNAATDLEEQMVFGDVKSQYMFNPENPFKEVAFPKKLALELINQGKNNEAILALEAHLQKNVEDGQTWRILGRILQENDQDQKSIPCFTTCLKYSPNNLDCLLSLGISCTNVLDEVKAMNYLKHWLIQNPKYKMQGIQNIIPDSFVSQQTYKVEQIKDMNFKLIGAFEEAIKMNNNDSELLSAMAILHFIKRDYDTSIDLFKGALNLDPTNYLLMNKVGATLAHLGRADEAIKYYHRALDIRPNYVRVWVNIGIAHAFKNLYDEAASFYLNALSFRPDAKHIWSYLHTCFLSMQRYDLISQISSQNPHNFSEFDVINLNDLPQPEINYQITTQKHILNKDSSQWLNQFEKK